jgi:hypothetical protein
VLNQKSLVLLFAHAKILDNHAPVQHQIIADVLDGQTFTVHSVDYEVSHKFG